MNKYSKMMAFTLLCLGGLLFLWHTSLYANSSSLKGMITVKGTGEPLGKVKITITSLKNQTLKYEMETDSKGYFYKGGLTHGVFAITLEKEGFVPVQSSIRLQVAQLGEFNTELEVLQVKTTNESNSLMVDAQILLTSGKYAEAITTLNQLIEKFPDHFILFFNRAVGYERLGDKDKALADYEKSLQLKPDFLLSLASAGKLYAKKGDFKKATTFYKKAFDLGITDTEALYNHAICLVNLNNTDEAKTVLEKLIALDSHYADAFYQLGIIYLGLNNNAKAKELLNTFITLDPENSNTPIAKEIIQSLN